MRVQSYIDGKGEISRSKIKRILPYRDPFLFIDKVLKLTKNKITAEKLLFKEYEFFKCHFRDFPLMPGTLTLEALGQAATLLIRNNIPKQETKDVLLTEIKETRFFKPLFPNDRIKIEMKIVKKKKNIFECKGEIRKKDEVVCRADCTLITIDKKTFRSAAQESKRNEDDK